MACTEAAWQESGIVSRGMNAAVEQVKYTMPTLKRKQVADGGGGHLVLRQSQAADKRPFNGLC